MRTGRSQSERKSKSHLEHATSAFVFSCNVALHVTKLICGVDVEAVVGLHHRQSVTRHSSLQGLCSGARIIPAGFPPRGRQA